jgi:tungsten cofactor oxidoreducase radical SAM maturase
MHVYNLRDTQIILRETDNIQKAYVELSSECNFDCEMCFRQSFSSDVGSMSAELLDRVQTEIETLPELKEVVLGGLGEPLLHPKIKKFIPFLKQRDIWVTITTNGALLEPFIDFFIEQGVNRIVLSFETGDIGHSNEKEILNTIKKIRERKESLQQDNPSIFIFMVVTSENIHDLSRVAGLLRGSGVREVILSNLLPATAEHGKLVLYPLPETDEVKAFKSELDLNILLDRIRCSLPHFELYTERACDFIEKHALVIRWDGEVAPCYRFLHSRNEIVLDKTKVVKTCSFGNIQEKSLLEIWNGRKFAWFRFTVHNSLYPSCIDCSFRDGCNFIESTETDCWGNENSCADCLWARGIVKCP